MRILHTADWHLGHTLRTFSRAWEHAQFLTWLLDTLEAEKVDALVVAGDVFETANPSSVAQRQYFAFLADASRRCPGLQIVVIGGNHDSAQRLQAPDAVLRELRVTVIGGLPLRAGAVDAARPLVELKTRAGHPGGLLAAVPFLRACDLTPQSSEHEIAHGVARVYEAVFDEARRRLDKNEAMLASGHLYLASGRVSELSERRLFVGQQEAVPADVFPSDVAYVALGHLHLAQAIGRDCVRYSGSPLPLSMRERDYTHQVVLVELEGGRVSAITPLPVPRSVKMLRIEAPDVGAAMESLRAYLQEDLPPEQYPFVEIDLATLAPKVLVHREINEALHGLPIRLVGWRMPTPVPAVGAEKALAHADELSPADVFRRLHRERAQGEPSEQLLAAFHELLDHQQQMEEAA